MKAGWTGHRGRRVFLLFGTVLVVSLLLIPQGGRAEWDPFSSPCLWGTNLLHDGGFEEEAVAHAPGVCPCPVAAPWKVERSGKGNATVQPGWSTNGSYAAVLSLDDSDAGDWISLSQEVPGAYYCSVSFTYSTWLSGGRETDTFIYLDDVLITKNHEKTQGRQPHVNKLGVGIVISSPVGNHTLRFLQKATTNGTGHSDWILDDIRLIPRSGPEVHVTMVGQNTTWTRPPIIREETPVPVRAEPALEKPPAPETDAFQPLQYLRCLARRIHDALFPFIPLREEGSSMDMRCS